MTTTVSFPYGKTERTCTLETSELKAVITGSLKDYQAPLSQAELVSHALANPIGTQRLSEMAVGKKNITIITSDHTRPMPSRITMPLLLSENTEGKSRSGYIHIGCHRNTPGRIQRRTS